MALLAHGEDKAPAKPPRWMPDLTAEAIQRLSPKIDTILVSQGARPVIADKPREDDKAAQDGGAKGGQRLETSDETMEQLFAAAGQQIEVLKPYRILCSIQGLSEYKPPKRTVDICRFDAVATFIFERGEVDPARVLWDAFRTHAATERVKIGNVEVLRRKALDDFYYWSPKPYVGVIVRRERLLEETVQRWSVDVPGTGPFPWERPEWLSVGADTTTWGIRRVADPRPEVVSGIVLSLDPKHDPDAFTITWQGASRVSGSEPKGEPAELILEYAKPKNVRWTEGPHPKVSVRLPMFMKAERELTQSDWDEIICLSEAFNLFYPHCVADNAIRSP
jgi:hypothetical protein